MFVRKTLRGQCEYPISPASCRVRRRLNIQWIQLWAVLNSFSVLGNAWYMQFWINVHDRFVFQLFCILFCPSILSFFLCVLGGTGRGDSIFTSLYICQDIYQLVYWVQILKWTSISLWNLRGILKTFFCVCVGRGIWFLEKNFSTCYSKNPPL